jgi:hypothetical protein
VGEVSRRTDIGGKTLIDRLAEFSVRRKTVFEVVSAVPALELA